MLSLVVALLLIPLVGAFVCYSLEGRKTHIVPVVLSSLITVIGIILVVFGYSNRTSWFLSSHWVEWIPTTPETLIGFIIDPLNSLMIIIITVLGVLVVLYSTEYISSRNKDHNFKKPVGNYYFWLLFFIGSMIGLVLSPNFLQLFIFWEMTTICSWALISYTKEDQALLGGFKAMIMTNIGGASFLLALVLIFTGTHSFSFSALDSLSSGMRMGVFSLLLVSTLTKAAQVPFFTWLPDAMVAPTPISAYLHAAAMVKAGVYLMARIAISNSNLSHSAGLIMAVLAVITVIAAVTLYFHQDDLKRLLAFSTIGHLGYVLFGIALGIMGSATALQGGVLHIINHAFAKGLLFLSVGVIAYTTGSRSIKELSGLGRRMPLVSIAFIVGLLAVTGIPPFSCFWSEFMIWTGAFQLGGTVDYMLGMLSIIANVVAAAFYLYIGHRVFFGKISEKVAAIQYNRQIAMKTTLVILMVLAFISPIIGYYFTRFLGVGLFT